VATATDGFIKAIFALFIGRLTRIARWRVAAPPALKVRSASVTARQA
jgi:hypothetical protein